jgi:hypothetical protein
MIPPGLAALLRLVFEKYGNIRKNEGNFMKVSLYHGQLEKLN